MNRFLWILSALVVVSLSIPAMVPADEIETAETRATAEVLAVMRAAEAGWNAGDLELYMSSYWRSDDLRFAGADRVTLGWESTLAGYRKSYPDKRTMGKLTFSEMDVTVLGPEAALVFGRWHLAREAEKEEEAPRGLFTLLLRKVPEGWRIVHDHTSSR